MAITDNNKPTIDRLKDLKNLYEAGILTQEEMEAEKAEILGTSTTPATKPIEPSKPTTFCPVCGGVIEEGTTVCPYCDEMISDEAKTCPYCGELISDEAKTCPYCGENVEEFFSAPYKEKEAKAAKDIQTAAKDTSSKEEIRVGMKKTPILYSLIIPLATLLIVSIGLLVFHINYEYTDYWVEEKSIILPIAGIAIIGLIIYYSILYKAKFGDIIKKLKNPNVIGISCFAILVIIVVSYVFLTAKNDDNFAKPKSEAQIEDNRSASEDEERDTVMVEAADPDDNEYGDHNDNSEDNTNSSELTLPEEDYNIDQDDKPETDEFTIN